MRTSLRGIANRARQDKKARFRDLYRLLNEENLRGCFYHLRRSAAPGVDKVTFEEYERDLTANLVNLVGRLKEKRYRAKLVRRKYIPKANGKFPCYSFRTWQHMGHRPSRRSEAGRRL